MQGQTERLEANVAHIQADTSEIKSELRRTNDRIDKLRDSLEVANTESNKRDTALQRELVERIDSVRAELTQQIRSEVGFVRSELSTKSGELSARMDRMEAALKEMRDSLASAKVWALVLYVGLAAGLLAVMARGFKWI